MALLAGLVLIGVLVIVHETGHFLVAKWFGIGAPTFSVGFGPRLFGFKWGETEFQIAALPLGGFVRLSGADPFGELNGEEEGPPEKSFAHKPVWQRLLVLFAGPAFNLLLPIVLFTVMFLIGQDAQLPSVGRVIPGTAAEQVGFQVGDQILTVNDHPVSVWGDIEKALENEKSEVEFQVLRNDRKIELTTAAVPSVPGFSLTQEYGLDWFQVGTQVGVVDSQSPLAIAGVKTGDVITHVDGQAVETWTELDSRLTEGSHHIVWKRLKDPTITDESSRTPELEEMKAQLVMNGAWTPAPDDTLATRWGGIPSYLFVFRVTEGNPAAAAGITPGDRLFAIDGVPVRSFEDVIRRVRTVAEPKEDAKPHPVTVTLVRDGERIEKQLEPKMIKEELAVMVRWRPIIGIERYQGWIIRGEVGSVHYGPVESIRRAVVQTAEAIANSVGLIKQLVFLERSVSNSLGGPIDMIRAAGLAIENGIFAYFDLIAVLSISLGVFNLLPVPVLDGGQIVIHALEGIRGRPVSVILRERLQIGGILAMAALMLWVTVLGIQRWVAAS